MWFVVCGLWFVCGLWYRKVNVVGPSRRDIVKGKAWNGREMRFIGTTYLQMIHEILASPTQCAVQVQKQQELRSCGDDRPHPPRCLKKNRASPCQPRMPLKKCLFHDWNPGKASSRVESSGRIRQPRFAAVGAPQGADPEEQKTGRSRGFPYRYP